MTSARRSLMHMQQCPPVGVCGVIGSLCALQFLIHNTFVLVQKVRNLISHEDDNRVSVVEKQWVSEQAGWSK